MYLLGLIITEETLRVYQLPTMMNARRFAEKNIDADGGRLFNLGQTRRIKSVFSNGNYLKIKSIRSESNVILFRVLEIQRPTFVTQTVYKLDKMFIYCR